MPDNPNPLTIDNSALILWQHAAGVMTTGFPGCDRPAAGGHDARHDDRIFGAGNVGRALPRHLADGGAPVFLPRYAHATLHAA